MTITNSTGKIYFIPVTLGESEDPKNVLANSVFEVVDKLNEFIVENEKTARRFIKLICPSKIQSNLKIHILNKHTQPEDQYNYIKTALEGGEIGLMSEAGVPGIADPGADIARLAHSENINVVPLVGPSSILMAMMASGMNGQSFAFNGYLPIDKFEKKKALKEYEKRSLSLNQSQIFIETPYRNNKLIEELINTLNPTTDLCIAADISLKTEFIKTLPISKWKKYKIDLHKRPCIFIIQK